MTLPPRVVVVTRATAYEQLLAHHATRNQAAFFLKQRGQSLDAVEALHHQIKGAVAEVQAAVPLDWRRNVVLRADLDRFLFEPEDVVVVVGQDGLVANAAKYLQGQPVVGVNPTPEHFDGVLVPHDLAEGCRRIVPTARGECAAQKRTMVEACLDGQQILCALNELFIGQRSHQSARYELMVGDAKAIHSSSGVIVATGTGGTGWARSIHLERHSGVLLPHPEERKLAFFVREAFPSVETTTELTEGLLQEGQGLRLISRMDDGVIFGDGMEADFLPFGWGAEAELRVAEKVLRLVA